MLTSQQIEAMRAQVAKADGRLILMEQNPTDFHHWSMEVAESERDEWLELLDLAAMAARIRER